ncbi:MAG: discoidin domain-containing protein [Prolixibacteraceae bacterium]|nr:discoidin domain-containing protein [Prolixibacteraceae bacterium]
MKRRFLFVTLAVIFIVGILPNTAKCQTYCNPLNLTGQLNSATSSGFGIADPTVVLFMDNYFLFATNADGYWYSGDLLSWKFVTAPNLPFEKMAPTAFVIGEWLYFCSSFSNTIFRSNDPTSGKWEVYCDNSVLLSLINDFTIFVDTDSRVYCYYGCSNNEGVMARELDPKNQFNPLGVPVVCSKINPLKKAKAQKPLQENLHKPDGNVVSGSWMNKYDGKYYYQCTEPIGDMNSLCDMVYVSESPLGPFTFAANNPFSYRPEGFVSGVANGSTFQDKFGNWWHIATITPFGNNQTPTKIGLFPAGFDKEGNLFTKTDFGDYPIVLPRQKYADVDKLDPEWALLTYNCAAQASSSIALGPATSAFDENISTFWSSRTGQKGEWLMVDLGSVCTINAFQINFAENKTPIAGNDDILAYQYLIEYSTDRKNWMNLSDRTTNTVFGTNPYEALRIPVEAQYIRITGYHVPAPTFAISEFRIFGSGTDRKPKKVSKFRAVRDYRNPQIVKMSWSKQADTSGYNIRYGTDKDKLYHSYQVGKKTRLTVHCPDKNKTYWFQMDAFNENGVTPGKPIPLK